MRRFYEPGPRPRCASAALAAIGSQGGVDAVPTHRPERSLSRTSCGGAPTAQAPARRAHRDASARRRRPRCRSPVRRRGDERLVRTDAERTAYQRRRAGRSSLPPDRAARRACDDGACFAAGQARRLPRAPEGRSDGDRARRQGRERPDRVHDARVVPLDEGRCDARLLRTARRRPRGARPRSLPRRARRHVRGPDPRPRTAGSGDPAS